MVRWWWRLSQKLPRPISSDIKARILEKLVEQTPVVTVEDHSEDVGVCTLVCHDHVMMYLLMIKSFLMTSDLTLPVLAVSDGTLNPKDITLLKKHIRNIRVISGDIANRSVLKTLKDLPYCTRYRKETAESLFAHNKKLFDPVLLSGWKRFVYIDADILFYQKPERMVAWITGKEGHFFHQTYFPKAGLDTAKVDVWEKAVLNQVIDRWPFLSSFNSGIIGGETKAVSWNRVEGMVEDMYQAGLEKTWLGEQMVWGRLFYEKKQIHGKNKTEILDPKTYLVLPKAECVLRGDEAAIHYHSPFKERFFDDGISWLLQHKKFKK